MTGSAVLTGAAISTPAVLFDVADPDPPEFVAVTLTLSVCPTSLSVGV
jgi:hypothetical protein